MKFKEWLILTEKIMIKDQEFRDPLLALQHIQKTHPNPENLAVTFTKIDKVGLNPQNKYETPLGIYLYTLDYVIEKQMNVPFAGDRLYFNVCEFTRPEKILHMTSDISNQKGMELLNIFPKEQVDQAIENIDKYDLRSNYSKLWIVTRKLANNKPTQWNTNLRKCGIDGFMDYGTGTIHLNEPTQCVVFAASALKLLHSIDNPAFNKTTDKFGVDTYKRRKYKYNIEKMSDEQIIGLLQSRRILDVKNLLDSAKDKDKVAQIIIEKKPELSYTNVENLLKYSIKKDEIAALIIKKKPELAESNVFWLLLKTTNKEKIARLLQKETDNISKLSNDNVLAIFYHITDKPKMAQIINKYHTKKTPEIQKEIDKYLTQTIDAK